jgi:GR25 family glycosyltransferase involved in LPS biosynthesis
MQEQINSKKRWILEDDLLLDNHFSNESQQIEQLQE